MALEARTLPERPFDVKANVLDISKIYAHTGWQLSQSFGKSFEQTWDWYVAHHVRARLAPSSPGNTFNQALRRLNFEYADYLS